MRFDLLGPTTLTVDEGRRMEFAGARRRVLLAMLLLHANGPVSTDALAEAMWGGQPPAGSAAALRTHVMRLRHAIGPQAAERISTRSSGYLIRIDEQELDVLEFGALYRRIGAAVRERSWSEASDGVTRALDLWHGKPLADVTSQALLDAWVPRLEGMYLQAREWRIEAELQLGHHDQILAELSDLVAQNPLRENLYGQLMRALAHGGRRAQALDAYRDARRVLADELGVEPGGELRQLHQRILAGDLALCPEPSAGIPAHAGVVPRQLPATVSHFTGRAAELAGLRGLWADGARPGGEPLVVVISGTAGVGKTALALHWAHQAGQAFPDGQLYVNLRGYDDGDPVPALDALAGFLRALGVPGRDVPAGLDERAAEFRSRLAPRRMLVVLDNARSAEQVRPLLPGASSVATVVTSRDALVGLVSRDGAQRLTLDRLRPADALGLLRTLIGARVAAEPDSAAALVELCCRLPLALRLAAELVAARPAVPLASLVGELSDRQRRLDLLAAGGDSGTAVRSVFSWSYRNLEPSAARVFRLLGLRPGPDLEPYAAAALTGAAVDGVNGIGRLLNDLERAHLIQPTGADRFSMHDLLHAYARELAEAEDEKHDREAALTGLLDHYLHTAAAAMDALFPTDTNRRPALPAFTGVLAPVTDSDAAQAWLDAERVNLIAAIGLAADHGRPGHVRMLAAIVERYLSIGNHLDEATTVHLHSLNVARQSDDLPAEAAALTHLGFIEWLRDRFEPAADYQQQAYGLFAAAGDLLGQARSLHRLALAERSLGRFGPAIGHATQVLAISEQAGHRLGQARALQSLGITSREQGFAGRAEDYQNQALKLFDEFGDPIGRSATLKELGVLALRSGDLDSAADHLRQADELCRETGNASGRAEAVSQLGLVHLSRGEIEQAAAHQERALALFRDCADRHGVASVLARFAAADVQAGRLPRAADHLEQALRVARAIGALPLEIDVLNGLGELSLATGDLDRALAWHTLALESAVRIGGRDGRLRAHDGLARVHSAVDDPHQAACHRIQAAALRAQADRG